LVGALCALALPARAADPPGGDLELAKAHFHTGEIYYERGRYPDAAREFEEAYRLSQRAELLYNMGKSYDGQGDHAKALGAYRRFLAAVKQSPDRPVVQQRVEALAKLVGRVTIKASVDGASVLLDEVPVGQTPFQNAFEVNPGGHKVVVSAEGHRTWKGPFVAAPGGEVMVDAKLESLVKVQVVRQVVEVEKPPTPVYKRWYIWTLVGAVVAAGVVTGAVLGSQVPPVEGPFAQLPGVR
jgi:tetratricopeptide (TPR) repeat protein